MRRLPLFRYTGRARSTSWAIALCTMFIVAGFSVVGGLGTSMDKLSTSLVSERSIVLLQSASGEPEFFPASSLGDASSSAALGIYFEPLVLFGPDDEQGSRVASFCVVDDAGVLDESLSVDGTDILLGAGYVYRGDVTVDGVDAAVTGGFSSSMFSKDWALVSLELAWDVTGRAEMFNFAIVGDITDEASASLAEAGFVIQPMSGIVPFLESGVAELEADALWALVPSCFAIFVLAYSFMGSEVSDRRHEIGILKTLGAGRRRILTYLLMDALIISLWGGALGLALGIVVSYAISTAASVAFTSVFVMKAGELLLLASLLATAAAGVVGALFPALRMTMSPPVEDLKEVGPSG